MIARASIANAATNLVFAALLFAAAGRLNWPAAWLFILVFFGLSQWVMLRLAYRDPALLAERLKPPMQRGQPLWDKIFLATMSLVWIGWLVLIGLDARFRWSVFPVPLQAAGAAGIALGYAIIARVLDENTFLAPVVKIQKERGHRVISTGPYAIVRHPMYAGAAILIPSVALMLGSWPGLAAALVMLGGLACRVPLEERGWRRASPVIRSTPPGYATAWCRSCGSRRHCP